MSTENRHTDDGGNLKLKTARTLKWNTIDKFSSQILYAVTGIVLANVLSAEDFGLAGIIIAFQAFAIIFVDSGFGAALLQAKAPTEKDYSTVFWFNLAVSAGVYALLFLSAPLIARAFSAPELVGLSRVMFLTFILNGLGIVQTNRLMKAMDVKSIVVANLIGLSVSGGLGIGLAVAGAGVWALVWQSVALSAIKTGWLWLTSGWVPREGFHYSSLKRVVKVGTGVFASSFLNTIFQYIYSFVIGAYYSLAALGVYTQADKWSKMGSASISQILTSSFVPLLSRFQDKRSDFIRMLHKTNRFTSFLLFPFMGGLLVMAAPIFHLLFGNKWDAAIPLFQILVFRGIFIVLVSLYNNYILSLGHARGIVRIEVIKDIMTVAAIFATLPFRTVEALVWGQFAASGLTFIIVLIMTCRHTGCSIRRIIYDMLPYISLTTACMVIMSGATIYLRHPALILTTECIIGLGIYITVLRLTGSVILKEAIEYAFGRFRRKKV